VGFSNASELGCRQSLIDPGWAFLSTFAQMGLENGLLARASISSNEALFLVDHWLRTMTIESSLISGCSLESQI